MQDRSIPLLVAALLALLAAIPLTRHRSPSVPPAVEATKATQDSPPKNEEPKEAQTWLGPVRAYLEFFGHQPETEKPDQDLAQQAENSGIRDHAQTIGYELDFMVALIPDPHDSHLSTHFDQALDAIQKAYNKSDYLLDRIWLPWAKGSLQDQSYRRVPGLLLFRKAAKDGKKPRLAGVFLVGETPKTGMHKAAFQAAVGMIRRLRPAYRIPILGPSFSGSMVSLRHGLQQVGTQPSFQIVTGSATAPGLGKILPRSKTINFCRMVVPDNVLKAKVADFLKHDLGWKLEKVAFFSETDTAYGKESKDDEFGRFVLVEFPNGLSDVRTAWEKDGNLRLTDDIVIEVPRSNLDLSLADPNQPVDRVGAFNPVSTAANDLALANLLTTISRQGIRYIGILATDARDRLFLARRIHQFAPDMVLFTFDNNLLYAHPEHSQEMDGMLVFSSFPLLTESLYSKPDRSESRSFRRQFTSEFHQGLFWAAAQLIPETMVRPPESRNAWIAVVGNGSLWPIAGLPLSKEEEKLLCPSEEGEGGSPAAKFDDLAGRADLQLVLFLGFLVLLARWIRRVPPPLKGPGDPAARRPRRLLLLGLFPLLLIGAVVVILGTLPLLDQLRRRAPVQDPSTGGLVFVLVLLGTYTALIWNVLRFSNTPGPSLAFRREPTGHTEEKRPEPKEDTEEKRRERTERTKKKRRKLRARILKCAGVLVATLALAYLLELLWMPGGAALFYPRARKLTSGLSPLVSLTFLCAAVYAWAFAELRRHRLYARQAISWPFEKPCDPPFQGCAELAKEVTPLLKDPLPWTGSFWKLLALALVPPALLLADTIQPIAEAKPYGWIFLLMGLFVFVLGAVSFHRFFLLWTTLERILNRLSLTRFAAAFARISGEIAWNPMKSFGWNMPSFQMLALAAEKLEAVNRRHRLWKEAEQKDLEQLLAGVFKAAPRLSEEIAARDALDKTISKRSQDLEDRIKNPEVTDFFAIRLVAYIRHVFAHLRDCLLAAMICGILLLLAVRTYAFQPKQFVSVGVLGWLLVVVCITLWTFVQMDRNPSLAAISGNPAGQVTFDRFFFLNVLTYGAIPLFSVAVTQFPSVGKYFVGWLNPLLQIVGGG